MPVGFKQCGECKKVLPHEAFHRRGGSEKGYRSKCKACAEASRARRRMDNRDAFNAAARRWRRSNQRSQLSASLKYRFGIGIEDYELMLNQQEGRCAICREVPSSTLCVDHDHETGVVRALLCRGCNNVLGHSGERAEVLLAAAEYLARFK